MDLIALIQAAEDRALRQQAALHGMEMQDGAPRLRNQNRSHSHMERMKARRGAH